MYRTHNNGELRIQNLDLKVKLCGWVQKSRDLGGMTFIDLRDRFGITQLAFNENFNKELKPSLIQPSEFDICAVIPIRGKPLKFGKKCQLELAAESIFSNKHINRFFVTTDSEYTLKLANDLGYSFSEMKLLIKRKAGLCFNKNGTEYCKSFGDCSKEELNSVIQEIIELGDEVGSNLR